MTTPERAWTASGTRSRVVRRRGLPRAQRRRTRHPVRAKPGHPAQATIATHRAALRELLQDIATTAGVPAPGAALQLHMPIDGATAVAVVDREPGAAASARVIATTVLTQG